MNLTNQRFGRLIALEMEPKRRVSPSGNSRVIWKCQCDCGNICYVPANNLRKGTAKSCGCYRSERGKNMLTLHGLGNCRLNTIWHGMRTRCTNPKDYHFKRYGAKGIKVCDEWMNNFEAFYEWSVSHGYRDDLSIDRINPYGDYEPNNCRWVDNITQQNNKTNNHYIVFNGKKQSASMWARELGIDVSLIYNRLKRGWSVEDTLTIPKGQTPNYKEFKEGE